MKLHTGDTVVIISGKDKGKTGSVLRVLPSTNRLVVSGVNMRTRHMKATPQQAGQKIQYEASIHASNVMIVDSKSKKRSRIGMQVDEKGKRRIAKRSGEALSLKKVSAPAKGKAAEKTDVTSDITDEELKQEADSKKKATETKKKAEEKAAKSQKPTDKKPFWKKMVNFGGDALSDAEVDGKNDDHSIPSDTPRPQSRSASRGS